jgi:hypothetical protein
MKLARRRSEKLPHVLVASPDLVSEHLDRTPDVFQRLLRGLPQDLETALEMIPTLLGLLPGLARLCGTEVDLDTKLITCSAQRIELRLDLGFDSGSQIGFHADFLPTMDYGGHLDHTDRYGLASAPRILRQYFRQHLSQHLRQQKQDSCQSVGKYNRGAHSPETNFLSLGLSYSASTTD